MTIFVWVLVLNFRNSYGLIVGEYPTQGACEFVAAKDFGPDGFVGHYCIRKPK